MKTTGGSLANLIETAFDGDPWYGLSASHWIAGVTAELAAAHIIPGCHSLWEIVLHTISWQNEVVRRLGGTNPDQPMEGDWPPVGAATEERWAAARAALTDSTRAAAHAVRKVSEDEWNRFIGGMVRNVSLGTGVSVHEMVVGLLQHNAYHSGQIALLRKSLEADV